ncbi:DUF3833 domain-containing protein [Aliiruegeria sabulilitoris]|uniref:DUF3833 domain-containing protein n=1 Tax=Aliiruegeria sabulilitoris TaxID=1510458 RepID=UPI0008373F1D|nr:DUF3833 domain-containing protein [Aliiruegeria sabulilitoris]NDR59257.1 DUF3833 domain-containing protein [Pseudoruegeria sp. M32A2M]
MTILLILVIGAVTIMSARSLLLSFRAQRPADYAATSPEFDLQTVLNGPILSEGLIYGPNGRMTNSFVAQMHGEWEGNTGTLSEDFTYSNGKRMQRKWFLTLVSDKEFTATADDIEGTATGEVSGSTVMMRYRIRLPEDAGGHVLNVTDWLYLTEDGAIMNRSEMRKFGIKVAELIATMRPDPSEARQSIAAQ